MQKVLTAAQMREVDRLTTERYGIPSIILMENAAHAVARVITEKLGGSVKGKSILILCGKGNNGGDGAALARILREAAAQVSVELFGTVNSAKEDARTNLERLIEREGISLKEFEPTAENNGVYDWMDNSDYDHCDVLVDAIFGTGISRSLDSFYDQQFQILDDWKLQHDRPLTISVDLPSGLIADEAGTQNRSIHADTTVTFTAPKPANILPLASRASGKLIIADIGSPAELIAEQKSQLYLAEESDLGRWMSNSDFRDDSYKNKRGHALIVAGSENYAGAAVLCGNAAIRTGVGLVTVATPRSSKDLVGGRVVPEVMVRPLAETESGAVSEDAISEIEQFSENVDAIAIGSGLSASDESTKNFVRHVVEYRTMPTILDADALTLMSPFKRVGGGPPVILTPHEGEFMRLLGTDDKEAIKDRVAAVREFSQKNNVILVLKGERALIGHPAGRVVVNPTGNSGLGKAGNGDTLTGIVAGFCAQAAAMEIDIFETVVAAVYIAGLAGDIAEKKYGKRVMTASDVRECLTEAFEQCEETAD